MHFTVCLPPANSPARHRYQKRTARGSRSSARAVLVPHPVLVVVFFAAQTQQCRLLLAREVVERHHHLAERRRQRELRRVDGNRDRSAPTCRKVYEGRVVAMAAPVA